MLSPIFRMGRCPLWVCVVAGLGDFPLEVRIKSLNYLADLSLDMLQRFDSVPTVSQGYVTGALEVHEHFVGEAGRLYCLRSSVRKPLDLPVSDSASGFDQLAMPVWVGDFAEGLRPFGATERLQPLERCLMIGAEPVKPLFTLPLGSGRKVWNVGIPRLWRVFDDKLCSVIKLSSVHIEQLKNEVIQGGFEIVRDLPDQNGTQRRWGEPDFRGFNSRAHWAAKVPAGNLLFETFDVFACPRYSRLGIIEGWLSAIGISHVEAA